MAMSKVDHSQQFPRSAYLFSQEDHVNILPMEEAEVECYHMANVETHSSCVCEWSHWESIAFSKLNQVLLSAGHTGEARASAMMFQELFR